LSNPEFRDDEQYTIEIIPRRVGDATHYDLQARCSSIPDSAGFGGIWGQWNDVAAKLKDVLHVGPAGIAQLKHHLDQGKSVSATHGSGSIHESFGGATARKFFSV
jgi:hypothetical protein